MDIEDTDLLGAFPIDMSDKDKFDKSIEETITAAIQLCGPRKALESAMFAQHKELAAIFEAINAVIRHQAGSARMPVLPMTEDMIDQFNKCVATTALVGGLMAHGVLDVENKKPLLN